MPPLESVTKSTERARAKPKRENNNEETVMGQAAPEVPSGDGTAIGTGRQLRSRGDTQDWTTVNRRETSKRRRVARKMRQVLKLEDLFQPEPYFEKYYVLRFPRLNINSELDVIQTDDDLRKQVGKLQ